MTDELKPVRCGCGGEAIILKADEYHQFPDTYYVSCTKCTAGVGPYDTEAEAVTTWNRAMGTTEKSSTVERTAKVEKYSFGEQCECGKWVDAIWNYCPSCGGRLEWK